MKRQLNPQGEKLTPQEKDMLNKVLRNLTYILPNLNENLGKVVPPNEFLIAGMLAYADGSTWNPGSGQGLYRYTGSAWQLIDGVAVSLTTGDASLGSPVTMVNANTFYDGPSFTLAAGTWHITGSVLLQNTNAAAAGNFTAKLWDGSTVESCAAVKIPLTSYAEVSMSGIITLSGSTTIKISAACDLTSSKGIILDAPTNNSPGSTASHLKAVKVA